MKLKVQDFKEEYKLIIILDSCRADSFEKIVLPKLKKKYKVKYERRLSLGSCTEMFLERLPFMKDTVIISSHPLVWNFRIKFKEVIRPPVDTTTRVALPHVMYGIVLTSLRKLWREKRIILWFIQPRLPFLDNPNLVPKTYNIFNIRTKREKEEIEKLFKSLKKKRMLRRLYENNLRKIVPHLMKILHFAKNKVLITSDHGEGLGRPLRPEDKPTYFHDLNKKEWEVRLVPYCVLNCSKKHVP